MYKFETIIFSDYFESSKNIYSLLSETKKHLQPDGKLIISPVNYRYSWFVKFLEILNLKLHQNYLTFMKIILKI